MYDNVLSALNAINVSLITRDKWISVGMALKEEGYPCSVWEEWSKSDTKRYKPEECGKIWKGFNGSSNPVKGGTIIQMAKNFGWFPPYLRDAPLDWNDIIDYDGGPDEWRSSGFEPKPTQELINYLRALFKDGDYVGFVSDKVWQNKDGKWLPSKGTFSRTAGDLIRSLQKHPDDLGATIGDWKKEAGAWIRFNPLDGKGVTNENVTDFRFALVESDNLPLSDQEELYRRYELPIAALVYSGGKSVHAIVHIDAENRDVYKTRVLQLYDFLEKNGVTIDRQNQNPARLSRMPGVTRNGVLQRLIAVNIGKASWAEWENYVRSRVEDTLPPFENLGDYIDNRPEPPEELIKGVLRRGHKMLLSGSSKAGKSFLLMELCACLASGTPWLGFECKQGRIVYINLEIDPASCLDRFHRIFNRLRIDKSFMKNITVWNLRGKALPLDRLSDILIERLKYTRYDAIILDPIYKVITGDENNATEMGAFCNQFDKICTATGCSAIYCHHHSKGAQGHRRAMDRASGSGVFARDPDAQLDMIELEIPESLKDKIDVLQSAWRMEASLREFANFRPVNFWFRFPVHFLDSDGDLYFAKPLNDSSYGDSEEKNLTDEEKAQRKFNKKKAVFDKAYEECASVKTPVSKRDMSAKMGMDITTVGKRLVMLKDYYWCENGIIGRRGEK